MPSHCITPLFHESQFASLFIWVNRSLTHYWMMVRKQRPKSMFQWRGFCNVTRHYKNARWWRTIFRSQQAHSFKTIFTSTAENTIAEGAGQVLYHVWWLYVAAKATQLSPTITLIVVFCLLITCILKQINVSVIYQLLIKDTTTQAKK